MTIFYAFGKFNNRLFYLTVCRAFVIGFPPPSPHPKWIQKNKEKNCFLHPFSFLMLLSEGFVAYLPKKGKKKVFRAIL